MNCFPNISIAISLIALTAGVWFLYKVQKENLGILYKVAAWFIIIATLLNMACCGMRCIMHGCAMRQQCYGTEQCGPDSYREGNGMCAQGGMNKRIMIMKGGESRCDSDRYRKGGGNCCGMCREDGEGCDEAKMDCCKMKGGDKSDMKTDMKKDTVVKKK